MIEKALLQIGLQPKEAQVYLTSLKLGSQPASVIAKHSHISRTTIYDIFKTLIEKGIANKTQKSSTMYFQVTNPENLLTYLEREKQEYTQAIDKQKKELQRILPHLKSLKNPLSSKPKVKFFEGEKGMREAYEDTLTSSESIRAYANVETMHKGLMNFFPDYYQRRAESGIFIRAFLPDNPASRKRAEKNDQEARETKFIAERYAFSPEIDIYDDKVLITSFQEKMAIIIQSHEISDLHKKMFDLLWESYEEKD